MTLVTGGGDVQGTNPAGVFQGAAALWYGLEGAISGDYKRSSAALVNQASAAIGGLRGKRVVDLATGTGNTFLEEVALMPREIICVDPSEAYLGLFKEVILGDESIGSILEARQVNDVLGDFSEEALVHLENQRTAYLESAFKRRGGGVSVLRKKSQELTLDDVGGKPVHAFIGNHWIHWPFREELKAAEQANLPNDHERYLRALWKTLQPLARLLEPGGMVAALTGADFVRYPDRDLDRDMRERTMVGHPLFARMHMALNVLLAEGHGITGRAVPKTTNLFDLEVFGKLVDESDCGLTLERTDLFENTASGAPIDGLLVRMPLWLGDVDLSIDIKLALVREAYSTVLRTAPDEELALPLQGYYTTLLFRKKG